MPEKNPQRFDLSASSIGAFKACPTRFRLAYREGIRKDEDTDSQRMGTNWHALHETYHEALYTLRDQEGMSDKLKHEHALGAAVDHLNDAYSEVPATKTPEEWESERQVLVMSFIGYLWYWEDDPIEVLASELAFDLPIHTPKRGMPLPLEDVVRRGKIDHVILWKGLIGNLERKSTSRSIDPSGDYWEKAQKDTQVSMYALAFRDMLSEGLLPETVTQHPEFDPDRFGNTLYDVWHKPTIKPTTLSQKDTAALIETGQYCGEEFDVKITTETRTLTIRKKEVEKKVIVGVTVDGLEADVTVGKSGEPSIRETPTMFGARLLEDIQERPEYYFQRKEIARTDKQLQRFRLELFNIYEAQRMYDDTGCWFENEQQCRATFACPFIPICYGPGADHVCETGETPEGFKRIFVDPTVDGKEINDGK